MKKILVLSVVLSFTTLVWSQTLKIQGVYNGKPIKIEGKNRVDGTVNITSIEYVPLDSLNSAVKTLEKQNKNLEQENKKLKEIIRKLEEENEDLKKQTQNKDIDKKKVSN